MGFPRTVTLLAAAPKVTLVDLVILGPYDELATNPNIIHVTNLDSLDQFHVSEQ